MKLAMEESEVEQFFLDGDQVCFNCTHHIRRVRSTPTFICHLQLKKIDTFFAPSGRKCLLFYYEEHVTTNSDGI